MSNDQNGSARPHAMDEQLHLEDAARDLEQRFGPKIAEAREQLQAVNVRVTGFIRQHPGAALLCAQGAGYLNGKLASRK